MEESVKHMINDIQGGHLTPHEVSSRYSPLALAYIGDSVYDLEVKTHFVLESNMQPEKYHKKVSMIVSANSQSEFIESILDELTEDELSVYKRARNSSPHTKAKNASLQNYLKATGFEAVIGYLYLSGQSERMQELITLSIEKH